MAELICAADDPRWHAERRKGITATDIVTILGLRSKTDPHQPSPYSLYLYRTGAIEDERQDTDRLRLGRELEPLIRQRWIEANDCDLGWFGWLMRSTARPWQIATMDAMTGLRAAEPGEPVELKSWADADRHAWDDGPPAQVRAQVLWQMDTLDVATGHVGVLFLPSGEFRSYVIGHDPGCDATLIETIGDCSACGAIDSMRQAGDEFMARLRGELPPPSPDGSAATLAALRAAWLPQPEKRVTVGADMYENWDIARDELAHWKRRTGEYEALLRAAVGDAMVIEVEGEVVARRSVYTVTEKEIRKPYVVDKLNRVQPKGARQA